MATTPLLSNPSTVASAQIDMGASTTVTKSLLVRVAPPTVERNQARRSDFIIRYGFQIGDWRWINNPRERQPSEGRIVGVMRDHS